MLEYLQPDANYEIDVKLVLDSRTESPFTEPERVYTGKDCKWCHKRYRVRR